MPLPHAETTRYQWAVRPCPPFVEPLYSQQVLVEGSEKVPLKVLAKAALSHWDLGKSRNVKGIRRMEILMALARLAVLYGVAEGYPVLLCAQEGFPVLHCAPVLEVSVASCAEHPRKETSFAWVVWVVSPTSNPSYAS